MKRRNFLKGILPVAAMGMLPMESLSDPVLQVDKKCSEMRVGDTFTTSFWPGATYRITHIL